MVCLESTDQKNPRKEEKTPVCEVSNRFEALSEPEEDDVFVSRSELFSHYEEQEFALVVNELNEFLVGDGFTLVKNKKNEETKFGKSKNCERTLEKNSQCPVRQRCDCDKRGMN
jgi:hypothetical protein